MEAEIYSVRLLWQQVHTDSLNISQHHLLKAACKNKESHLTKINECLGLRQSE